jgi:ATP-dependent RNA helicase DDX23/PRP28
MFSATMPPSVEKLTKRYLRNPITISIGSVGRAGKPEIEQRVEFVSTDSDKKKLLLDIMSETEFPVMIFVNSKRQADFVGTALNNAGITTTVLHSGKLQDRREEAINDFKAGRADALVSTDVAGRGIDIPNVQHVINYDMAKSIEDYTHRIGRTARGVNKRGISTSFILAKEDDEVLPALKQYLQASKQFVPGELQEMDFKRQKRSGAVDYFQ